MHRVHSLTIWPGAFDTNFLEAQDKYAPHLEVLRFVHYEQYKRRYRHVKSPIVMPKLRLLEVSGHTTDDWDRLLPAQLPTVTDLVLTALGHENELAMLKRCICVRRLTMKSSHGPLNSREIPTLPNLSHLTLYNADWTLFLLSTLPSLRHVDVYWGDSAASDQTSWFFEELKKLITSAPFNPAHSLARRPHRLSLVYRWREACIKFEDATGIITLTVNAKPIYNLPLFFQTFIPFVQSLSVEVYSVEIKNLPKEYIGDFQVYAPLYILRSVPYITTICIGDVASFSCFLSHPAFGNHVNPITTEETQKRTDLCVCDHCREVRASSYSGLKTLLLNDLDEVRGDVDWDVVVDGLRTEGGED